MKVPEGQDPALGIVIGPPDLTSLGLSEDQTRSLHQELFRRNLITLEDVRKRPHEIQGALQAVLKADAIKIINLYK